MKHQQKRSKKMDNFDYVVYVVSIVGPLTTFPQIWKIWITKSVEDVSLITWLAGTLLSVIWLTYGLKRKDSPITITNLLWLLLNGAVVAQIFLYS